MRRPGYLRGTSNLGGSNLGKFFCAPNVHKFAEINALATKVQALNPGSDLMATNNSRNQPLSAVLGLWAGGGACCGDCTDGLDSDFDFLTGILAKATAAAAPPPPPPPAPASPPQPAKAPSQSGQLPSPPSNFMPPPTPSAEAATDGPADETVDESSSEEIISPPADGQMFMILGGLGAGLLLLTLTIKLLFRTKKKKKTEARRR